MKLALADIFVKFFKIVFDVGKELFLNSELTIISQIILCGAIRPISIEQGINNVSEIGNLFNF